VGAADEASELRNIVSVAQERNAAIGVTGALILARNHFAQVLEGKSSAIDELMLSIRKDRRHTDINVVDVAELPERQFPEWTMAYSGPSTYVSRRISPLLPALQEAKRRQATVRNLLALMQELICEAGTGIEGAGFTG
jgi:hypothetical protein